MGKMTVYHSSNMIIQHPEIRIGRNTKDFASGFYCTINCRHGEAHDYDIVIGAMANDQIYNFIADYIDGIITREQFWTMAKFKYPAHQINFCTDAFLGCLTFIGSEEIKL